MTFSDDQEMLGEDFENLIVETMRRRRLRHKYLPTDLLADPAWEIMLDLYLNEQRGRKISVSSLCGASQVPHTTALRWIIRLQQSELIGRQAAIHDRRSSLMHLTGQGRAAIEGWARHVLRAPETAEFSLSGKLAR